MKVRQILLLFAAITDFFENIEICEPYYTYVQYICNLIAKRKGALGGVLLINIPHIYLTHAIRQVSP